MMIRSLFSTRTLLPVFATAMMVACGGTDEGTPTPTPTPVPPMDDYFRITELLVLESDQGLDLNGDGDLDNNIEVALEQISATVLTAIEDALIVAEVPFEPDCAMGAPCGDDILDAVSGVLDTIFTVDAISQAINGPIESGDQNYLLEFVEAGSGIDLKWYLGEFVSVQIVPTTLLGTQPGNLDASGNGLFGPGNLTLTLSFDVPTTSGGTTTYELPITLYDGMTQIVGYTSDKINDLVAGGVISNDDLLELVRQVLETVVEAIPVDVAIDIDAIIAQLEAVLISYSDYDINDDGANDGFSMGLGGQADGYVIQE